MVLDSILQKVLSRLLGNFFYGIIKENIKTDLLKGRITISNIGLHPNFFENMNLPFDLYYSYVEKIDLMIPWRTEEPLTLNISTIYGIFVYKDDWDLKTVNRKKKQSEIKDLLNQKLKAKPDKKQTQEEKKGGIAAKIQKLFDNVQINISSIHLRFQSIQKGYSFGIKIEDILCGTVNKNDFSQYFNREKSQQNCVRYLLKIDPLGIYFNPNQKIFLSTKKQFAEITNVMAQMDRNNTMDSYGRQIVSSGMQNLKFILALTIKAKLRKFFRSQDSPKDQKFQCEVNFHEIEFAIGHEQFHAVIDVINRLIAYQSTCDRYESRVQINIDKERDAEEILALMKRKKNTSDKQRLIIKKMARNHLGWVFRRHYVNLLQKKFLKEAVKKQITIQHLFQNRQLQRIISKINIKLVKQWIQIAIILREKYKKKTNIFTSSSKSKLDEFADKYINTILNQWNDEKVQQIQEKTRQQIGFKLFMNIQSLSVKISKQNLFGMGVYMKNLKTSLWKRNNKNFILNASMEDLQVSAFNAIPGQKNMTYIPFLQRNLQLKANDPDLLQFRFEKSPIGQPFVFSSTFFKFNSIEVTIFPEIYQRLYQTFIQDQTLGKKKSKKKGEKPSKKQSNPPATVQLTQQYNIIQGVVHSPWIVIPLSYTNDISKQCWVLRLGDLKINTNEALIKRDFYENLTLQLKQFELKYFTSIKYFHCWLNNNMDMEILSKLPSSKQNKIIDVIQPISCYADLKVMKKYVKQSTRKNRQFMIANIKIDKVIIKLPKFIVDKLKQRVDLFEGQKKTEFIEMNPKNILEDNIISGLATITTQKVKNMLLFTVLKNYYLYFFMKGKYDQIILMADIREHTIRITSDHHSYVNQGKTKKIYIQLKQENRHQQWHRYLSQLVSKRDRKHDSLFMKTENKKQTLSSNSKIKQQQLISDREETKRQIMKKKDEADEIDQTQIPSSQPMLVNISFVMGNLSIQLIDQSNNEFLYCSFDKTKLIYENIGQKTLNFAISEWNVEEKSKKKLPDSDPRKKIPFLGSKRFFGQKKNQDSEKNHNFLSVKAFFNDITEELSEVDINVDQLYISWDIFIFNKILAFFFFKSEADDAPSVASRDKRSLKVKFKMDRFYLYCFHDESQLIALFKFHFITIDFSQSKIEEAYLVNCLKFQAQKFVDNNATKRVPMILCRSNRNVSVLRQSALEQIYDDNYLRQSLPQTDRQQREGTNPMFLSFRSYRYETEKIKKVTQLKKKFGADLMVSEVICQWKDTIIYFQQEQTLRLLTYFLNQILGTVASKFKKKEYSQNYITKALQIKKMNTLNVSFQNFIILVPAQERNTHFFEIIIDRISFSKNLRNDRPEFEPKIQQIQTKVSKAHVFYESIVFQIKGVQPFYKFGIQPSIPIVEQPFNIEVLFSKLNFPRQYEPILKSLSDIDKTVTAKIKILPSLKIEMQKIIFITFLQIFYQNIKHRDGKAAKFQTPPQFPSKKIYIIQIQDISLNLYQYREGFTMPKNLKHSKRISAVDSKKKMRVFQKFISSSVLVNYENIGSKGNISVSLRSIFGTGQLPISKRQGSKSSFLLEMMSDDGQMTLNLKPVNYELDVNLDNLTHVIDFISYDSDYVSNKIMPKKSKQSWQNISIFPEKCCLKMRNLSVMGTFCITLYKDFKNPVAKKALQFLSEDLSSEEKQNFFANPSRFISDKEIKVNGQQMQIFIKNQQVGELRNLYFSRLQLACKASNRRLKKQSIHLSNLNIFANISTLKQLFEVYDNNVKKSSTFKQKIYFEPCHVMPVKKKTLEKRTTTIQLQKIIINIIKNSEVRGQIWFQPYFTINLHIPKIVYATYLNQQQISIFDLQADVMQIGSNIIPIPLVSAKEFCLNYFVDKQSNEKKIQIQNAKKLKIYMKSINQRLSAYFVKDIQRFIALQQNSQLVQPIQERFAYKIVFANLTSRPMQIFLRLSQSDKDFEKIFLEPNKIKEIPRSALEIFNFIKTNQEINFQQDKHGPIIKKKMSQISVKQPNQLYTYSVLRYRTITNGISFNICQNSRIWNLTRQKFLLYLLNRSKQPIWKQPLLLDSQTYKFYHRDHSAKYIFIQTQNINQPYKFNSSTISTLPLIKIDDLTTHSNTKVSPLKLIYLKREESRNIQSLNLVIFNKFKLQNYLCLPIEANFMTLRPFTTSLIPSDNMNADHLIIRIGQIGKIQFEIQRLKASENQIKKQQLILESIVNKSAKLVYKIYLQIKRNSKNDSANVIFQSKQMRKSLQLQAPVSSDIIIQYNNWVRTSSFTNYQILLKISGKTMIKNSSCQTIFYELYIEHQSDLLLSKEKKARCQPEEYVLIPENTLGIYIFENQQLFQRKVQQNFDKNKRYSSQYYEYIPIISALNKKDGQKIMIWDSLSIQKINTSNQEEIYIFNDICLIENKTKIGLRIQEYQHHQQNRVLEQIIKPKTKGKIKLMTKPFNKEEKKQLFVTPTLKLEGFYKHSNLNAMVATTLLPLSHQSNGGILYWSIDPFVQQYRQSEVRSFINQSRIVKITIKNLPHRYHLIFEEQNQNEEKSQTFLNSQALMKSMLSKPANIEKQFQVGYKIYNQMPKGFIITIRQEGGKIPIESSYNQKRLSDSFAEEQNSILYMDNIELSQDLINSHHDSVRKSNYKNMEKKQGVIQMRRRQSGKTMKSDGQSYRLQISREKNSRHSKAQLVEYVIKDDESICVGLTNLGVEPNSRTFTIQFYQQKNNIEYQDKFIVDLKNLPKKKKKIILRKEKLQNMKKTQKRVVQNNEIFDQKKSQVQVGLFIQKKKQGKIEIFIRSLNIKREGEKPPQKLKLLMAEIALTIEISSNPKDSLTLQLQNFYLERIKNPPNSHQQHVIIKLNKILLRQDQNLSILGMLDMNKRFLKGEISMEKIGQGQYINFLKIEQSPLNIHVRQGILFKFLRRIIDVRRYYFDKNILEENPDMIEKHKQHPLLRDYINSLQKQIDKSQKASKKVYIQDLWFMPTNLYISYSKDETNSNYEDFIGDPIIKYFVLIPGMSQLKVSLPILEAHEFEGTTKQLTKIFMKEIKKSIGSTVFSSLSSISLFDSPVAAIDGFFQYTRAIFMISNS